MKLESSSDNLAATAMAIAGRSLRPCDVCGRERAKWYCKADEAYLCEHCDVSVHSANAVSQRHERVRLAPNGTVMKNVKRLSRPEEDLQVQKSDLAVPSSESCLPRKRPRSVRTRPAVKMEPKSPILMKQESMEFPEEAASREVPTLLEELSGSEDNISPGFAVPCAVPNKFEPEDEMDLSSLGISTGECNLLEEEDFYCDVDGFMTASTAVETDGLDHVFCGIDFSEIAFESGEPNEEVDTPGSTASCPKVKSEEPDEFNGIKLEFDEMIGFEFGPVASVKEEEEIEHKIKLKLNYEDVLNAWSDRGPFWTEGPRPQTVPDESSFDPASALDMGLVPDFCMESAQTEALGQVPVVNFGEDRARGGGREARVMRYREKRRTRLFSKKIRYEVRKLNAERRPRLKGRFVKRTSLT